jgi:hypothetical protein
MEQMGAFLLENWPMVRLETCKRVVDVQLEAKGSVTQREGVSTGASSIAAIHNAVISNGVNSNQSF